MGLMRSFYGAVSESKQPANTRLMNLKYTLCTASHICILALFASCSSQSKRIGDYAPVHSINGLEQDKKELPALIFKRPGAADFDAYDSFLVDSVRVIDTDRRDIPHSERLSSLQRYFKDQLERELRKSGHKIALKPGPKTLRISTVISDVEIPGSAANAVNVAMMVAVPITPSVGGVTVETAFSESTSGRIDAVAIERSEGSRILNSSAWSTEADIKSTFRKWAVGIRKAVDKAHGR